MLAYRIMKPLRMLVIFTCLSCTIHLTYAQEKVGEIKPIQNGKELIEAYLNFRETAWYLHPPPSGSQFVTKNERNDTESWFEQSWSKWLATPTWFSTFSKSPDSLSPHIQDVLWEKGDIRPVRVWEHPGKGEIYLGRIGEEGQIEIFAHWPAPAWEPQKGESPEKFYNREVGTRRVSWLISSPRVEEMNVEEMLPFQGLPLMMMSQGPEVEFRVKWTSATGETTPNGVQVDFGAETSPGPFTVWYHSSGDLTASSGLPGHWIPAFWQGKRPEESVWEKTFSFASYPTPTFFRATLGVVDSDSDAMDDGFELWYFEGLSEQGTGDVDQDGLLNYQEFLTGTDPTTQDVGTDGTLEASRYLSGLSLETSTHSQGTLQVLSPLE